MSGRAHERRTIGAARGPRRGEQCLGTAACPLGLRTGGTRVMSASEEAQLVSALAELLCDWLAERPGPLSSPLRSRRCLTIEEVLR